MLPPTRASAQADYKAREGVGDRSMLQFPWCPPVTYTMLQGAVQSERAQLYPTDEYPYTYSCIYPLHSYGTFVFTYIDMCIYIVMVTLCMLNVHSHFIA